MENLNEVEYPPGKEDLILFILERWVMGEISTDQADRELKTAGVKLPESEGV